MNEEDAFTYMKVYGKWLEKANKLGYDTVKEMLQNLYWGPEERTTQDVANLIGQNQQSVINMMKRLGVKRRLPAHLRKP